MKALVIGPINAEFDAGYNHSVARALEELGVRCELLGFYVSTPPGLMNRLRIDGGLLLGIDTHYRRYVADFNRRAVEAYDRLQPDLVFVIRGSKLSAASLSHMQASVRVLWCQDVVRRCELLPEQLRAYDRRYVFEATDVDWLASAHGLHASFLPMGFDPLLYHAEPSTPQDIDVCFVGAYYPERRAILERLVQDFPTARLRFYGRHVRYRETGTWRRALRYWLRGHGAIFVNRTLQPQEINRVYARSKICLNMHHAQSQRGCNPRVFEILGAGAFQIVDAVPYVREHLQDCVVAYDNYEQLRDAVSHWLGRDRRPISRRGAAFAADNHAFVHRVREVLRDCALLPAAEAHADTDAIA